MISVTEVLERERLLEGRAVRAERERRIQVAKELEKAKRALGRARAKISALERAADQSTESVRKELVLMRKEVKKLRKVNEKQAIKVLASAQNDGMGINGRVQEALRNLPPGLAKVRASPLKWICKTRLTDTLLLLLPPFHVTCRQKLAKSAGMRAERISNRKLRESLQHAKRQLAGKEGEIEALQTQCALQERAFREKLKSVQEEKAARRAAKAASSPKRKVEHLTDDAYVQLFKLMVSCYYGSPHHEPPASKPPTEMLSALKGLGAPLRRGLQQQSSSLPYGTAGAGNRAHRARSFAKENPVLARDIVRWALTSQTKLARKARNEAKAQATADAVSRGVSCSGDGEETKEGSTKAWQQHKGGSVSPGTAQPINRNTSGANNHDVAAHELIRSTSFKLTEDIVADAMRRSTSYRRRQMRELQR